jgi:hypothetical protein
MTTTNKTSRRNMLRVLGAAGGALVVLPVIGCGSSGGGGGGDHRCSDLSGVDVRTRNAMGYTASSTDPSRRCSACTLYIAPSGTSPCGGCQAFPGPVEANGYCNSFVART